MDEWIPIPQRVLDKPFLFPVEKSFSIPGRGTVVTGQVERGTVRKGEEVEFVGYKSKIKTIVTGMSVEWYPSIVLWLELFGGVLYLGQDFHAQVLADKVY